MKNAKQILCSLLTAGMTVGLLSSCGKTDIVDTHYRYDLSEYIQLGEYEGLDAIKSDRVLTEERIWAEIQTPLYYYAQYSSVSDRGAQTGDKAVLSYVGFHNDERIVTQSQHEIVLGNFAMPEDFENAVLGHRIGDEFSVTVTYPEDYEIPDYAGKTLEYNLSLDALYEYKLPKYTDEFVRGYLGYDSIEEYENAVRTTLEEHYKGLNTYYILVQVWAEIEENTTVLQYPEKELDAAFNETLASHKALAEEYGIAFTDYVSTYHSMSVDDFYDSLEEEAKTSVKFEMICYAIARAEGITVTEEEYIELGTEYAVENYEMESLEELEAQYSKDKIHRLLLCDKVQEWVADAANIVDSVN